LNYISPEAVLHNDERETSDGEKKKIHKVIKQKTNMNE